MGITQLPRRGPEFDLNLDKLRAAGAEVRSISGFCPVQAEASVDGLLFYFRPRGEHWFTSVRAENIGRCTSALKQAGAA